MRIFQLSLSGNLAVDGCVVKSAGVVDEMLHFEGTAVVYESQDDSVEGILNNEVKAGDVVVIRYEGPKGGPGMQEMLYPTSYLKLKEISYIHAEGYPAAEMKHGPIALIDEDMPLFVIATKKGHYEKVVSNIQEIKSRSGKIIAIVTEGDVTVKEIADHVIEIPETEEALTPLLTTIPFQLLSYHIAVMLDKNVDQPRNLAKSVTVE